jgi:hypothetical protein
MGASLRATAAYTGVENHVVGVFSMYRPDHYLAVVVGLMHVSDPEHGSATRPTHKNDAA